MSKASDLKQVNKLTKLINIDKDKQIFSELDSSESFEEFIINTTKRDYFNNLNNTNRNGRGSDSGVGSYLVKEVYKQAEEAVFLNMSNFLDLSSRQNNVAKFFMMNTTFLNFEEDALDSKAIKSAVVVVVKILINNILKATNHELLEDEDGKTGITTYNNYIPVLSCYKEAGTAILEEQIMNSVIIQQPLLAKSLKNRQKGEDLFTKLNQLALVNSNITCVLKNGCDQNGNLLLNTNSFDKDNDLKKIGCFFIDNIINNTDIFCVKTITQKEKGKITTTKMVALNEEFLSKISNFENMNSVLKPKYIPKPAQFGKLKAWTDFDKGGFDHIPVTFIKNANNKMLDKLDSTTYKEIFSAANNLQDTLYSTNNVVFDTINKLMNADTRYRNKGGELILPYRSGKLSDEIPKLPKHLEEAKAEIKDFTKARNDWFNKKEGRKSKDLPHRLNIENKSKKFQKLFKEYKEYQVQIRLENDFLQANRSKYNSLNQALNICRLMGESSYYLPVNIDWRTRYYYMSVLNPQNSDNIKGMLQSGKVERVTDDADLYWLYNCGANDYGHDKKHPDFKRDWVLENIEQIAECGRNPMENITFWGEADKPFMFLNFCTEIAQYLDNDREYIDSSYFCFYDGSCNGSQVMAAMVGDRQTALLTNLTNDPVRHDLYSVIAKTTTIMVEGIRDGIYTDIMEFEEIVNKKKVKVMCKVIKVDTKYGEQIVKIKDYFEEHSEEALAYGISRKLVKQNVMTMTYGATDFGRREQVESVYKSVIHNKGNLPFEKESIGYKSSLVSSVALGAIKKENPGVAKVMEWLESSMSVFDKVEYREKNGLHYIGLDPKWYGSTGAEVVQSYKKTKTENIKYRAAGKLVKIFEKVLTPKSDLSRNEQGIIANITHYQDASHMTKCINECAKHFEGFVCVHDSFGVSVKNAGKLYNIVRYTFVETHEAPFLENLYNQWYDQISIHDVELANALPKPPPKGDYNVSESLESIYSFI